MDESLTTETVGLTEKEKIVREAKENLLEAYTRDKENRDQAELDLRFKIGDQWDAVARRNREREKRPCLTFNQLPKFTKQISGDARQNKPSIKVDPVDSAGDPATADIFEGVIREIEHRSKADALYSAVLEQTVDGGFGFLGVNSQYVDDESFDQELKIVGFPNQFACFPDPSSVELDGSDYNYFVETEVLTKEEFLKRWPKAQVSEFDDASGDSISLQWWTKDSARYANYWRREKVKKRIVRIAMQDGSFITEEAADDVGAEVKDPSGQVVGKVVKVRDVESWKVCCYTVSGNEILDQYDWPGTTIPRVPVHGEETNIKGQRYYNGIVRYARDPQRFWNFWLTSVTERIALSPKNPWLLTPQMIEGYEKDWAVAHLELKPYLLYEPDSRVPGGRPMRETQPEMGMGEMSLMKIASQSLNDTTGIYPPAYGAKSNETSGRAILARQRESDTGTFVYLDNVGLAIRRVGEILVEVIPKIYDSSRIMRIRGKDQKIAFVPVNAAITNAGPDQNGVPVGVDSLTNQPVPDSVLQKGVFDPSGILVDAKTGQPIFLNDLNIGKYDVFITVGQNYATKRIEAANSMIEFIRAYPQAAPVMGDLIAKNMDWEGADEIAQRLQMLMQGPPPGAQPPQPGGRQDNAGTGQEQPGRVM